VSDYILDASYALAWCFADRATANTDAALRRLEARQDNAIVPWVLQLEAGNALGKTVTRAKLPFPAPSTSGRNCCSCLSAMRPSPISRSCSAWR
jgi:hypothetical protein